MDIREIIEKENLTIDKNNIFYDEPMIRHTSFKVGGPADCFIKIKSVDELKNVLELIRKYNIPYVVFGNGSNILVTDKGFRGIILKIDINKIEMLTENGEEKIIVGAGNKISEVAQKLLKEEFSGFEELSGIPGTIGGAIKMNAGAHGKEIKDILEYVIVMNQKGSIQKIFNKDLDFGYRTTNIQKNGYIVLEAKFLLKKAVYEDIKEKMDEYKKYRIEKQPIEYPSAGSTFKRGEGYITAKLIDDAGLKGYTIGGAEVSEKHAGFVINKGEATANDILQLIQYIKDTIKEKFGVEIILEIEVIGEK